MSPHMTPNSESSGPRDGGGVLVTLGGWRRNQVVGVGGDIEWFSAWSLVNVSADMELGISFNNSVGGGVDLKEYTPNSMSSVLIAH